MSHMLDEVTAYQTAIKDSLEAETAPMYQSLESACNLQEAFDVVYSLLTMHEIAVDALLHPYSDEPPATV